MKKQSKKKVIFLSVGIVAVVAAVAVMLTLIISNKGPFKGTVVESETGKPLADVLVTDGMNVVKTDENGNYELNGWRKSHFVAITVPSGYKTDNFYIPVDKATESYDFSLDKSELTAQESHCFVQISDTEIGEKGTGDWLNDVRDVIKENNAAFLIHTGDICYEAGLKKHIEEMNTETMGCTVRYIIGNHDYVDGKFGEELYESLYGPVWYSFDVGNVHYVVTPFQVGGDYKSCYNKDDRWRWLENDLKNVDSDMKVVIFNHTLSPSDDYVISFDRKELDLKQHNLIAWVFGHYHYNYVYQSNEVLNICAPRPDSGGIDSSAAGTRVISISADGKVSTKMHYYDLNKSQAPQNAVWSTKLDGNVLFCDTVYDSGRIYSATVDDDYPRTCGIYCLNASDGKILWSYETENSIKNNICIDGDRLVAMDADGKVYCLNKTDGSLLWQKQLELGNALGTSSALCISDGTVYAGASRVVTALSLENGEEKWSLNRDKGENSPAEFVVSDGKVYVNSHWNALAALNSSDGKSLWDNDDSDIRFRSSTPVVIDSNTVLVADDDAIMLVDTDSGKITSKTEFEEYNFSSSGQPVYIDGTAYIPTANKGLIAFDVNSKEMIWKFETDKSILFTSPYVGKNSMTVEASPILDGGKLIFGANDGYIYTLDAKTGTLVNKHLAGSAVLGEAALQDGRIYAGTFDGYIVCYENN